MFVVIGSVSALVGGLGLASAYLTEASGQHSVSGWWWLLWTAMLCGGGTLTLYNL